MLCYVVKADLSTMSCLFSMFSFPSLNLYTSITSGLRNDSSLLVNVVYFPMFCSHRGLFIIDDRGILRQITMNDLPVGRSVDETLRLVQAFQYTDKHGEVCPAGWKPGAATVSGVGVGLGGGGEGL